jgi:plasmid stabilization system protein ParE
MSRTLMLTISAFQDLDGVYAYLADMTSVERADAFFEAINDVMHGLLEFPFRGVAFQDAALPEHANIRRVLVWTHQIERAKGTGLRVPYHNDHLPGKRFRSFAQ